MLLSPQQRFDLDRHIDRLMPLAVDYQFDRSPDLGNAIFTFPANLFMMTMRRYGIITIVDGRSELYAAEFAMVGRVCAHRRGISESIT